LYFLKVFPVGKKAWILWNLMRLNFVNFRKIQSSADVCWSGSADQQCFKSAFLSATSCVVGGKQHVDGLLCLVQTASLLRVVCLGGGYHPSWHPVPRETCFPKGPRLLLSHSSYSVCCFCLVRWWPCKESSKCWVTHMASSPSHCTHHLVIFIPASPTHVWNLLNIFKTGITAFCRNCIMLQTWRS
jgi:hypothetical protein